MKNNVRLAIDKCPNGHGFLSVSVESVGAKSYGGRRLTGSKCCGSWETVQAWTVDADEIVEAIREYQMIREATQ